MKIVSWWRNRKGILKEAVIETYYDKFSIEDNEGNAYSSLTVPTVCERFRRSYPPPPGSTWVLRHMAKGERKGYYYYKFELKEMEK